MFAVSMLKSRRRKWVGEGNQVDLNLLEDSEAEVGPPEMGSWLLVHSLSASGSMLHGLLAA